MSLERSTVLVTGAGGFLGAAVLRVLASQCAAVRALLGPPGQAVRPPPPGVAPAFAEIDDADAVRALARGADVLVHLAGPPSVAASFEAPAEYARVHVVGTATVLEAALRAGVGRVVHVSSAEVYGQPRACPVAEDHPLEARSPYGAAKIGAEQLVNGLYRARGGDAIVLRPFSVYGPGQPAGSLLSTILRQARDAEAVELEDLRPARDYCFVNDVASAIARACAVAPAGERAGSLFNVGTGRGTSAAALAAAALRILDRAIPVRAAATRRRPAAAEILRLIADTTRAQHELGWWAVTPLEVGLERTIAWFSEGGGAP